MKDSFSHNGLRRDTYGACSKHRRKTKVIIVINLEATYTSHPIKAQVVYNIQEKTLDTFPCLNSDILLTVSYINIGFDS